MQMQKRDFTISQNGTPTKVVRMAENIISSYMERVQSRFSKHRWSVSERFPVSGSD